MFLVSTGDAPAHRVHVQRAGHAREARQDAESARSRLAPGPRARGGSRGSLKA
jgi:hypothetical protein